MTTCLRPIVLAILLSLARDVCADDRRPLREVHSANDRFLLRIQPGRPTYGRSASCRATLFEHKADSRREQRVWREKLVNEIAPQRALIRNDGRFVITLDEFRRGGASHAVVVYGEGGKLLRDFDLRELLHGEDWEHVELKRNAIDWLVGSTPVFVNEPPQFVVKLKWGRTIRIDLETVQLLDDSGKPIAREAASTERDESQADPKIPPEILALFEQATSAPAPGDQVPPGNTNEKVAQALEKMRQMAEASGVPLDGLEPSAAADATRHAETEGTAEPRPAPIPGNR